MIGETLGGRYKILDRVGGGGMALVYKGQDLLLNRYVAVKILRQQYVHDEEFIRRFRREAQSAASLSHPNVVSIYDVGQEDEVHYIVMEYIEGRTLNDLIKEKAPLQVEEAIHIASQICDALDHAHQNGIIHRDIKPHNILLGRNGRVKVTDFGIARAATASTITQTGSVVGSVHYFSPEHAKGAQAGEMSDLYSLGIVLYQMLTAKLPFLGESPISVALKHLQEDVEAPREVNPLIPQSVENLIMKSMRKRPEERYQTAKEMLHDLETCLLPERRNEAKIQSWPSDDEDDENTRIVPAIRPRPNANPSAYRYDEDEDDDDDDDYDDEEEPRKRPWIKPVLWIIFLLALLGGMLMLYKYIEGKFRIENAVVPNLVGKMVTEAEDLLRERSLTPKIIEETSEEPKDQVLKQYPEADIEVRINSEVTLYVSKGPELIKMPSVTRQSLSDTLAQLREMGINVDEQVKREEIIADDIPDTVVQQYPGADQWIDPKTVQIKLRVTVPKETFKMPNLVGMTLEQAKITAQQMELVIDDQEIEYVESYTEPKGNVTDQFPYKENDEVSKGTKIKLFVSSGLPKEAGEMTISVILAPENPDTPSEFRIEVKDATSNGKVVWKDTVEKITSVDVKIVVSPDKYGAIHVFENDQLVETTIRSYKEYLDQASGAGHG